MSTSNGHVRGLVVPRDEKLHGATLKATSSPYGMHHSNSPIRRQRIRTMS